MPISYPSPELAGDGDSLGAISQGKNLARLLGAARFRQAIDREVQQLGGSEGRLHLTARQLEFSRCCIVAQANIVMVDETKQQLQRQLYGGAGAAATPLLAAQEAAEREVASWSSEAMLRLEPEQPQSWSLAAAQTAEQQRSASLREALEMSQRAVQLAQQQRSNWWVMEAGAQILKLVAVEGSCTDVDRATLEAALALAQQLPTELQRCRRVLPEA